MEKDFYTFNLNEPKPNYIDHYEVRDYGQRFMKFGTDNLLPQFMALLTERSPIHGGIIDTKIKLVSGNKLTISNIKQGFKEFNNDLENTIKKCIIDFVIFDSFALHIIPNRVGGIAQIEHIDFSKVRYGLKNEYNKITEIYVSNDWENTRLKENKPKCYKVFNSNRVEDSVFIYKTYRPGKKYYSLPSYIGAIDAILTDYEISKLHLNQLLNGLYPSFQVEYPSKPESLEERLQIAKNIELDFRGALNAGKPFITFKSQGQEGIKIVPINSNDTSEKFLSLAEKSVQDILSAHGVTSPLLFGIRVAGQLGGRDELIDAQELFHNRYVLPTQEIIKSEFKKLIGIDIQIEQTNLLSTKLSESTLVQILEREELRKIAGMETEVPE